MEKHLGIAPGYCVVIVHIYGQSLSTNYPERLHSGAVIFCTGVEVVTKYYLHVLCRYCIVLFVWKGSAYLMER